MDADTIFAVASGAGQAAIAVMRLSGPGTRGALGALCGRVPPPRRASFRRLRDGDGAELDQGVVVWMPGPGSYTGRTPLSCSWRPSGVAVSPMRWLLGARSAEPGNSPAGRSSTAEWT